MELVEPTQPPGHFRARMEELIAEHERLESRVLLMVQGLGSGDSACSTASPASKRYVSAFGSGAGGADSPTAVAAPALESEAAGAALDEALRGHSTLANFRAPQAPASDASSVPVRQFFQQGSPGQRFLGSQLGVRSVTTSAALMSSLMLEDHDAEDELMKKRWVRAVDPNSRRRLLLDSCLLVLCLWDGIVVPVNLAWRPEKAVWMLVVAIVSSIFWWGDMAMNFLTSYYKNGVLVTDVRKVALRYLLGPFVIDLGINGMDVVSIYMELAFDESNNTLRVFRLLKMSRLARVLVVLRKQSQKRKMVRAESSSMTMLSLGGRLIAILLFLNHLICCAWFFIGSADELEDTDYSWLDMKITSGVLRYREASATFQYLTALHWSFTQMTPGSMSVVPQNSFERAYNVVCLVIGLFVSALLVSQLSAKMVRVQTLNHDRLQQMDLLTRFLQEQAVPHALAQRIQHQVHERASMVKSLTMDDLPALSQLPSALRGELSIAIFARRAVSSTVTFFWYAAAPDILPELCKAAELQAAGMYDEIFQPGQKAEKTYVSQSGGIVYVHQAEALGDDGMAGEKTATSGRTSAMVASVDCDEGVVSIEEGMWISTIALWCDVSYSGTLQAISCAEFVVFFADRVLEILRRYPCLMGATGAYARAFAMLASASGAGSGTPELLDLDMNQARVLMAMPLQSRLEITEAVVDYYFGGVVSSSKRLGLRRHHAPAGTQQKLAGELKAGKCVVTVGSDGGPLRTVLLAVLDIQNAEGQTLVKLASEKAGELVPEVKLPASKLGECESGMMAARRVLRELPDLAGQFEFAEHTEEIITQKSTQLGIRTEYIKARYVVLFTADDATQPGPSVDLVRSSASKAGICSSKALKAQVSSGAWKYLPPELNLMEAEYAGGKFELYAWLWTHDFEKMSQPAAMDELRTWLQTYRRAPQDRSKDEFGILWAIDET